MIRKTTVIAALIALVATASCAQELVISGRVVDTGSPNEDTPVTGATVMLLDEVDRPIKTIITNGQGIYRFSFPTLSALTGKEHVQVKMEGYSLNPTPFKVRLTRTAGMKLVLQEDVLLTNEEKIRKDSQYRGRVAQNTAQAAAVPAQKDRANALYASIAGLPPAAKDLVFDSVKTQSGTAYFELLRVNERLNKASDLRLDLPPAIQVLPQFDQAGRIRLSGTVGSQQEMDTILRRAGDKGFGGGKVVNGMRIKKAP